MQKASKKVSLPEGLSKDGGEWLTLALDPFHDYEHQISGYPDIDGSQTVVSCYQYQSVVTAPAGVAGNWDAHIFSLPQMSSQALTVGTESANWATFQEAAVANQVVAGPLNIMSNASGQTLIPTIPANGTFSYSNLPSGTNATDLVDGCTRLIGMGFEVVNTTADLNKQGSVTVYRMPQYRDGNQIVWSNNAGTFTASIAGERWRRPPSSVAEANLLKGSRTWAARKGCYCVCAQNSSENPLKQLSTHTQLISPASGPGAASVAWASQLTTVGTSGSVSTATPTTTKSAPFDTTGAFFIGLSNSSSLTVTVKFYVERAPTYAEKALAVLASPSAALDYYALELYAQAISTLPVGVPVDQNAFGDWWRGVLRVVKMVAPKLGLSLAPWLPAAPLVGKAAATIAGSLDSLHGDSKSHGSKKSSRA